MPTCSAAATYKQPSNLIVASLYSYIYLNCWYTLFCVPLLYHFTDIHSTTYIYSLTGWWLSHWGCSYDVRAGRADAALTYKRSHDQHISQSSSSLCFTSILHSEAELLWGWWGRELRSTVHHTRYINTVTLLLDKYKLLCASKNRI